MLIGPDDCASQAVDFKLAVVSLENDLDIALPRCWYGIVSGHKETMHTNVSNRSAELFAVFLELAIGSRIEGQPRSTPSFFYFLHLLFFNRNSKHLCFNSLSLSVRTPFPLLYHQKLQLRRKGQQITSVLEWLGL